MGTDREGLFPQVVYQRDLVPHRPKVGICGETGRHCFRHVRGLLDLTHRTAGAQTVKNFMVDLHVGLVAFELPLAYIRKDKFNQPIFACNNLSGKLSIAVPHPSDLEAIAGTMLSSNAGECWPAAPGGGPQGSLPPHVFSLYFKEGGVGTFLPLYFRFVDIARNNLHQVQQQPSAPHELVATA